MKCKIQLLNSPAAPIPFPCCFAVLGDSYFRALGVNGRGEVLADSELIGRKKVAGYGEYVFA